MLARELKLLTVEDYAASQGISTEIVDACIKAGLLAGRSHKGKKYVVNIPLSPYFRESEDATGDLISEQTAPHLTQLQSGIIAKLVEKMTQKAAEIKQITNQATE